MGRRKATEGNDELDPMSEERRARFTWGPDDLIVFRDGVQIHPEPEESEPKECGCGCGELTRATRTIRGEKHSEFRAGHDARHKSRLLTAARRGDVAARAELIERGWATNESIDSVKAKLSKEERLERRLAKLHAKADRLRAELAEVEAQLGAQS